MWFVGYIYPCWRNNFFIVVIISRIILRLIDVLITILSVEIKKFFHFILHFISIHVNNYLYISYRYNNIIQSVFKAAMANKNEYVVTIEI